MNSEPAFTGMLHRVNSKRAANVCVTPIKLSPSDRLRCSYHVHRKRAGDSTLCPSFITLGKGQNARKAYKPDSVQGRDRSRPLDDHSSDRRVATTAIAANPDLLGQKQPRLATRGPYLALLPVGLAVPSLLPGTRWALTPPFHPYLGWFRLPDPVQGGLFSVALSVGLPRPGVTRHRYSSESGLSSPCIHRSVCHKAVIQPSARRLC